jgi:hypothetical protein
MQALRRAARAALSCAATQCRRTNATLASAIERSVTADTVAALNSHGYAVVDNVFGPQLADDMRAEILALRAGGHMRTNATHLVKEGTTKRLEKAGIWEAEAHALGAAASLAPQLGAFSRDRTLLTLLTIFMETSRADALHYQSLKLQVNAGSAACFPMHYDSDAALDSRRVTALFYLNPDWQPAHGGQLVLYPCGGSGERFGKRVELAPLHDRLVLFSAQHMLHRVLPSAAERVCFTLWLFARDEAQRKPGSATVSYTPAPATLAALLQPSVVKHAAKAVFADEWAASIEQAHPASGARDAALAVHAAEVATIERVLEQRFAGAAALLRELRAQHATTR